MSRSARALAMILASSFGAAAETLGSKPSPLDTDWVAPAEEKARTSTVSPSPEGLERGHKLYLKHCSDCHGVKGKGDGPLSRLHAQRTLRPPYDLTLPEVQSLLTDGEIFWKVTVGYRRAEKVIMPAFKGTIPTDDDRWRVVQFVRTLGQKG